MSFRKLARKPARKARPRPSLRLFLERLEDRLAPAVFNLENMTLQQAITAADSNTDPNNTILLGASTYSLTGMQITINSSSKLTQKSLVLSGQDQNQSIIESDGTGAICSINPGSNNQLTVVFQNLTLKGGKSLEGGALSDWGANVTLQNVGIVNNTAQGTAGQDGQNGANGTVGANGLGGGIYLSAGSLTLDNCTLKNNQALGGAGGQGDSGQAGATYVGGGNGGVGGNGQGGAIYVAGGQVAIVNSTISNNQAIGGPGGAGGKGFGDPQLAADGGSGGAGGEGRGAGIFVSAGTVNLFGSTVQSNTAGGGAGGNGGRGGNGHITAYAGDGGVGGAAGFGSGGGIYVVGGTLNLVQTTLSSNTALGGNGAAGGDGGTGHGGGFGRSGGNGGNGCGGGLFLGAGQANLYACSAINNRALGGQGGPGGRPGGPGANGSGPGRGGGSGGMGGMGGAGGFGVGGGLYVGNQPAQLNFIGGKVDSNVARGGQGGLGQNGVDGGNGAAGAAGPGGQGGLGGDGGPGGAGGNGAGGGVFVASGTMNLLSASLTNNLAQGGNGNNGGNPGNGGNGGNGGATYGTVATKSGYKIGRYGDPGGNGGGPGGGGEAGNGGPGYGGGIFLDSGVVNLYQSTGGGNSAVGGVGGNGGNAGNAGNGGVGGGGGTGTQHIGGFWGVTHKGVAMTGGAGGNGGSATNGCTSGNGGDAKGGGIYVESSTISIVGSTLSGTTSGGDPGVVGAPGKAGTAGAGGSPNGAAGQPGQVSGGGYAGTTGETGGDNLFGNQQGNTAGSATQLVVSPMPPTLVAGTTFPFPLYVVGEDANGNVDPNFSADATIQPQVGSNSSSTPFLLPTLGGLSAQPVTEGQVVFSNLSLNLGGTFALKAVSGSLSATTNSFTCIGYTPAQVRSAYGLTGLPSAANGKPLDGTGQSIAIVDNLDDPNIYLDLDTFDQQFGLTNSAPTLFNQYGPASSFLTVLNQNGQASPLPATDPTGEDEMETVMDVEWAHAIAPGAHIYLIETNGDDPSDDMAAVKIAAIQPGVSAVSISLGFNEGFLPPGKITAQDEATYDSYFTTPGVTFLAATGDQGTQDASYPAFSPNVVAVGGTTLIVNPDGTYNSETGWGYVDGNGQMHASGGGPSIYETEPTYQQGVQRTGYRTIPDVSLLGDAHTGSAVWDTFGYFTGSAWSKAGGTSLATPCWAGLIALVNQGRKAENRPLLNSTSPTQTLTALYQLPHKDFHSDLGGNNGTNQTNLVDSTHYDEVTGLGTPVVSLLVPDLINYGAATLTPETLPDGTIAAPYNQTIKASGPNTPYTLTYQITTGTLPTGLTITPGTDTLTMEGTPSSSGSVSFTLTVTDKNGANTIQDYSLTINPAITLSPQDLPEGCVATAYSQTISASAGTGVKTMSCVVTTGTLPTGLSLTVQDGNPGTLDITGTPTAHGTVTFDLTATDAAGAATSQSYTLTIDPKLTLTPGSLPESTINIDYAQTITTSGGIGDKTISYTVTDGTIPNGLVFTTNNGDPATLTISGNPSDEGTVAFDVTATDTAGTTATQSYSLTINPQLGFNTTTVPASTKGVSYSQTITTTGGTAGKSMTYKIVDGTIPDGLTFAAKDADPGILEITGTPLASGTVTFEVTATDTVQATATQSYTLIINPEISLSPADLPVGIAGTVYSQTITAADGTDDKTMAYSITAGALPTGLSFSTSDGDPGTLTIAGTPMATGTVTFDVKATDSVGAIATQSYTLAIVMPRPVISEISPSVGPLAGGTVVILTGSNFSGVSAVKFGTTAATSFTVNSSTQITATAPAHAVDTEDITVTTSGGTSALSTADQFTYENPPSITTLKPSSGPTPGGTSVVLTGTNFTGASSVNFGTIPATSFLVNSATQITAVAPTESAGSVDITVTTPVGTSATSSKDQFTFVTPPTVSVISPTSGPIKGGTVVTLTGSNFTGASAVKFGTAAAVGFTVKSPTQITATAPAEAVGTVDITVTTAGGPSATTAQDQFTYVGPLVTSINPGAGPLAGGTVVIITGSNFTGASTVKFGTTAATSFTVNSATQITATSPAHAAGTVDLTVTAPGGTSALSTADQFTYENPPSITTLKPSSGPTPGGTSVVLTGTNFTGASSVDFGTIPAASFLVNSATQITAVAPTGSAGSVDITVTTPVATSATSSTDRFTYVTPPTVSAISPTSGPIKGGTVVTITGSNFTGTSAVKFGTKAATSFTVNSPTQITATAPAAAVGTVDITVATAGGTSPTTAQDQFSFVTLPVVSSLNLQAGPLGGATMVILTGSNFTGASAVKFGTAAATSFTVNSATQITATAPAHAAGTVDVTVTTPGGTSAVSTADTFNYEKPAIRHLAQPQGGSHHWRHFGGYHRHEFHRRHGGEFWSHPGNQFPRELRHPDHRGGAG